MKTTFRLSALLVLVMALTSCGGGSSAPDPAAVTPPVVASKATVAITLTDASADDYDHAFVNITSVELLSDDGNQVIFEGDETVDLLALRDTVQLFAVNENVTPTNVEKIRIKAGGMVLVVDNSDGSTTETDVELVANGKIDLNPRGTIPIAAGEVVFISLDWDVNESLKLTETGQGRVIMRPVIFVDIGTEPAFKEGLIRVTGVVQLIATDGTAFRICSAEDAVQIPENPILNELCLDIVVTDKTGLFAEDGRVITVGDLNKGDIVTVLGLLRRSMDGPAVTPMQDDSGADVDPTPFQVLAIVVEGGDPAKWQQLLGTLKSAVDSVKNTFGFLLDNGQGFPDDTVLTGNLDPTARIFLISSDEGVTEITGADLMAEDRAAVDAVQVPAADAADPDVLRIAIMLARTPGDGDMASIKGVILSVDTVAESLMVATDIMDRCVTTHTETKIYEVLVNDDSVENILATLADLDVGAKIFVTGAEDGAGCFAADLIIAEGQAATP
jgi:hypothetical protein